MPIEILMPALSPTMTEGNLTKWVKKEGDDVRSGDVIAEIETDKATMEVEAADDGKLGRILVPEGSEGVKVKTVIALLVEEGEEPAGAADAAQSPAEKSEAGKSAPEDEAVEDQGTGEEGASSEQAASTMPETPKTQPAPKEAESSEASRPQASVEAAQEQGRLFVSPLARRMAQQAGIDLASISGSGPQGRIVKADIDAILGKEAKEAAGKPARPTGPATPASAAAPPQERPAAAPPSTAQHSGEAPSGSALSKAQIVALAGNPPYTEQKLSGMRRVIARRLSESKQTIPHFYMSVDCEIDRLLKIRAELNRKSDAYKISVNDFVIRAVALALKQVPAANASWSDEAILLWDSVDIAVAVALDEGLITPIVKQADRKGLAAIATETKELAARARSGKLKPEEFQGGTFSISNLGMHGIRDFAAVINPPHGGILAIGAGEQRAVVKAGALGIATVMSCTLSCDHRVVDGAVGAQFLAAFKKLVEDPLTMLL